MTAPDLTEKVLGYRQFTLSDDDELCAVGVGRVIWMPGANCARCLARHIKRQQQAMGMSYMFAEPPKLPKLHDAPAPGCGCGLYGLHQPSPGWLEPMMVGAGTTVAAIRAWGRMEVHESGFRAEFAEVVLLAYEPLNGMKQTRRIQAIAADYGVQAVPVEEFAERAKGLGRGVPGNLLPEKPKPSLTIPESSLASQLASMSQYISSQYYGSAGYVPSLGGGGGSSSGFSIQYDPEPPVERKPFSKAFALLALINVGTGGWNIGAYIGNGPGVNLAVGLFCLSVAVVMAILARRMR